MYIHTHTIVDTYVHTYVRTYMHAHAVIPPLADKISGKALCLRRSLYLYVHVYACMCLPICLCTEACMYACMYVQVSMHAGICAWMYSACISSRCWCMDAKIKT